MASRRTRIKGIANIPQRRKINNVESNLSDVAKDNILEENDKSSVISNDNIESATVKEQESAELKIEIKNNESSGCHAEQADEGQLDKNLSNEAIKPPVQNGNTVSPTKTKPIFRRKFIKPSVSANVINRKPKPQLETDIPDTSEGNSITTPASEKVVVLSDQLISPKISTDKKELKPHVFEQNDIILNETHFLPQPLNANKYEVLPIEREIKRLPSTIQIAHNSDTEYPPPPSSPSKINRSRIKAIPRLSQRKTSFSASESEDETRRNFNRHRNDSMCSTTSVAPELSSVSECMSPQRPKEFNSIIQKKCRRTEQSRKLAEARRHFNLKFLGNKPDRQKLTMIDLIFYNPTTNPMTESKSKKDDAKDVVENENTEVDESSVVEESVDDPKNEDGKSDEENEMPVPQIKIGPQGEIILDEKSLVIESKQVKQSREELKKSKLVDGDFDTGYGIYKRAKRSKDWTHNETLRFYKALNTIGTDFSLMCQLFPKRTRRELKTKFKKEERINRNLIDKAVMQPCDFEFSELKQEVELEEREMALLEEQKAEELKLKQEKNERVYKKRKAPKIKQLSATEKEACENEELDSPKAKIPKKSKALNINSILDDSDADESDIESEDEIIKPQKPTRSGRIPKCTNVNGSVNVKQLMDKEKPDSNVEPGSLVVIPSKGPNGEAQFKLYMVTPDQQATPLDLGNDVVSKVVDYKTNGLATENILTISAERRQSIAAIENNVTIPAIENNVTIPADHTIDNENMTELT